ncbi:MAG TPA: hypothetical protein VF143_10905, partial [Candidatus Nanopelagicales bacterium]
MTSTQIAPDRTPTSSRGSSRVIAALVTAAAAGLAVAWAMPRGPMSATQSLVALVLGAGVGAIAGWLMCSRWAALLAPAAFGAA